jgi:hypothetical protein
MKVLTGDDNGLIKCTQLKIKEENKLVFKYGLQKEDHNILNLRWSLPSSQRYFSFIHMNGIVKTFDTHSEKTLFKKQLETSEKSIVKSIYPLGDNITSQTLLFAQTNGVVSKITLDIDSIEDQKQEELFKVKKRAEDKKLTTMERRSDNQFLFLGQFLPQVFDVENCKSIWKGKNLPNDENDLEIPLYDTSGQFLPQSNREFVVSNGYGKLRLYDVNAQARPVRDTQACNYLLSKVRPTECGNYVIYSTQKGELAKCDIRMDFRMVHKFKGARGTIRDIAIGGDFVA